jgi:anthranilate synthase component 1
MPEHHSPAQREQYPFTGDLLTLQRAFPERYPHLLESAAHNEQEHFDILFAFPGESLVLADGRLCRNGAALATPFLTALDTWWQAGRIPAQASTLPFEGGWFLYLGYELAAEVEPSVVFPPAPQALPTAFATRFPAALLHDRRRQRLWLVAEAGAEAQLAQMRRDLESLRTRETTALPQPDIGPIEEQAPEQYLAAVQRALRYIRDGDVFQVNLSRRWQTRLRTPMANADLYARLRSRNPGPFNGLATWGQGAIISSSPERLVRVRAGVVDTRPIAGTRPRGAAQAQDQALSAELLGHPKERAEHVMLIDLERNDLGRVCVPGSVEVNELMVLESYAHVHHIVSNVRGRLRAEVTPGQVIRALFPGGTITGCPKVRCMQIIAELEGEGRGPYTGAMGYLTRDGSMDLNILIRTLVRDGDGLSLRAGAGIVADSIPERELEETRAKARGLLLALREDPA